MKDSLLAGSIYRSVGKEMALGQSYTENLHSILEVSGVKKITPGSIGI